MKKIKLGKLLIEKGLVSQDDLDKAYQKQGETGQKIGQTLVEMSLISEDALCGLLAEQLSIPYIDLRRFEIDKSLVQLLPEVMARRHRALVLERKPQGLLVGFADPLDIHAFDEIVKALKVHVDSAIVSEQSLIGALDTAYRRTEEISEFAEELSGELLDDITQTDSLFDTRIDEDDTPVVKLLNSVFKDAVQLNASDIHIEPDEALLRIRFRVDGILQESVLDERRIAPALVQRLKLRAQLDISERRLPQDGRFHIKIHGKAFDIRVATMPTSFGESVVLRLLDQTSPIVTLGGLGLSSKLKDAIEKLCENPHGMLLVTGPTGSGKTTTLYSFLNRLNQSDRKIITVEDPVEYRMHRINQVQVHNKIGLGFARVLRSVLRHDPDVIMVGEIRDEETADIAMKAAITGHFVLATLHTNDAISTTTRLIDMGIKGYMVGSAVKAVISQRLLRKICTMCAVEHAPSPREQLWLQLHNISDTTSCSRGKGCSFCGYSGFKGRVSAFELLVIGGEMLECLRANDASGFTKLAELSDGYFPLIQSVKTLLYDGKTSISEAIRVIGY